MLLVQIPLCWLCFAMLLSLLLQWLQWWLVLLGHKAIEASPRTGMSYCLHFAFWRKESDFYFLLSNLPNLD